jgi:type VI secretion system secreted protein Hcp
MPQSANNTTDILSPDELRELVQVASRRLNQGSTAKPDWFLKLDGIDGESTDSKHSKEIEVLAYSHAISQSGTFDSGTGGGTTGRAGWHPFVFVAKTSKASPKLALACATGQHIGTATLVCRKAGKDPQEFNQVQMKNVTVYTYKQSDLGDTTPPTPLDVFALAFSQIQWQYKPQKPDGSLDSPVTAGYDLAANKTL